MRKSIRKIRGLSTSTAVPAPEDAVLARNLMFSRPGTAKTRPGTRRAWATRTANAPTLNLYGWRNNSGTVLRMAKTNGSLESWSLTAATAKTELETGLSTAGPADMRALDGLLYVADQQNGNLVSTGASGASNTLALRGTAPTSALSPTETSAAGAAGFGTGTFRCCYALNNPTTGDTTPPRAYESVTKATGSTGIRVTTPADPGNGYTNIRFYRTKVNETTPFYLAGTGTTFASTFDYTVLDVDLGLSATPQSTLHNPDTGEIAAVVPPACSFCEVNKGVLWLASSAANPLRLFAAKSGEPTNFSTTSLAATPAYHHDLLEGQGQRCMGVNDLNGSLVAFKDFSITVKNGGFNSLSWEWYTPVDGVGCIARWTRAVAPGMGVFFASANGVYIFDGARAINLSDNPSRSPGLDGRGIGVDYRALDFNYVEKWTGIWSEEMRAYLLAVTPAGATTCTRVYAYFWDTGEWGTLDFGMGLVAISCMGLITNPDGEPTVYLGTSDGYALEMNYATFTDGPISGTVTGTITSRTSTTFVDSTASFYTTGDKLVGQVVTVRHSASSYESRVITASDGTSGTVATWTTTPAVGVTYFIGAIQSTLALGGFDAGDAGEKQWHAVNVQWSKQAHTIPVRIGFTLDDGTVPTYGGSEETCGDVRASVPVDDFGTECGAYLDCVGTSAPIELKGIEYDLDLCATRSPAS